MTQNFGELFSKSRDDIENNIYSPEEISEVMSIVRPNFKFSKTNKIKYFNVPCMFDIETSSFYIGEEKHACMYMWSFCIYGVVIIGRTWEMFTYMIQWIIDELCLSETKRLIIYVHNLGYEFQFMRKWFRWDKVFSIDHRKPLYCLTSGIEFRCSYLLSGYSLENLPIKKYIIKKQVGLLDYDLIRTPESELTKECYIYSAYDVLVGVAYIQEKIENENGIKNIPLTKTGYVRRFCRNACFKGGDGKYNEYRTFIKSLTIDSVDEYKMLKRAFAGGFTHANSFSAFRILLDIICRDLTSSYPAVMCSEKFPMSTGEYITISDQSEFFKMIDKYCVIMDIRLIDISPKIWCDHPISSSRCKNMVNAIVLNGRVLKADELYTTVTDMDLITILKFYNIGELQIGKSIRYRKGYLPKDLILSTLKFYNDKTKLKGVKGWEIEYLSGKENNNSIYGMMVTDIIRDLIEYDTISNEWLDNSITNMDKEIEKYNKNRNRFLFYPWGVWVTAYARRNIFKAIEELNEDYHYSDTDSVYYNDNGVHDRWFEEYNIDIQNKICKVLDYYGIDNDLIRPKNIDGDECPLGVFTVDGKYEKFKTLGAKRYAMMENGKFKLTVAGLGKEISRKYIATEHKGEELDFFDNNMIIDENHTGKLTMTYIDDETSGYINDYKGVRRKFHELSSIHSEKQAYHMGCQEYIDTVMGLKEI